MNVFELFATINLNTDEYEKELKGAEGKTSKFAGTVKNGMATAAKTIAATTTAAAATIGVLAKKSVAAYAEYEQLIGGVETLFRDISKTGDGSVDVINNAAKAYKTAGISANTYMEQVTSFSASLMAALDNDGKAAAAAADQAITDMADNANKMGTSMEYIQNAYQGFAKQNYTMLDNLKLGYGGTAEEMKRLLKDAQKITGVKYDISNLADVYEAIHVIQGELGITGTTAEEAEKTISGSLAMAKASFENLIAGIANGNADVGELMDEFISSVGTAWNNILPVAMTALENIGGLIETYGPDLIAKIPEFISKVGPQLLEAAGKLTSSIAGAAGKIIGDLVTWLSDPSNLKKVGGVAVNIIKSLFDGIANAVPGLKGALESITSFISSTFGPAFESLKKLFEAVKTAIGPLIDALASYVTSGEAVEDITTVITSALEVAADAFGVVCDVVAALIDFFIDAVDWGKKHEEGLTLIATALGTVTAAVIAYNAAAAIKRAGGIAEVAGMVAINAAIIAETVATTAATVATTAFGAVMAFVTSPITLVVAAIGALIAIVYLLITHWDDVSAAAKKAWDFIVNVFKGAADWFNDHIIQPVVGFFEGMWDGITSGASAAWEGIKSAFGAVADWFINIFTTAWTGVKNVFSTAGQIFVGIVDGITSAFKTVVNAIIGGINKVVALPFNAINGMLNKIHNVSILGLKPFSGLWSIDPISVPQIPFLARGGILKQGEVGLLEGNGAEAVVPLENNARWISKVAEDMQQALRLEDANNAEKIAEAITASTVTIDRTEADDTQKEIAAGIRELKDELYESMVRALTEGVQVDWNERELMRLVQNYG